MLVFEQLYQQPLAKDRVTQQIEVISRTAALSGVIASSNTAFLYTLPADRFGILNAAGVQLVTAGASQLVAFSVFVSNGAGPLAAGVRSPLFVGSPVDFMSWQGQVICTPGSSIALTVQSTALLVADVLTSSIQLVTFPRGNIVVG